ncbi:hypothetical protein [Devosia sp.]|uniref:hypothetical protein n=1 Tax=Devosia sp. TaxID=1871048 RepID=UPI003A8D7296
MKLLRSTALAVMMGASHQVLAQEDAVILPTIEDIAPSEGYGANPPDILGVPFGTPRDEAIALFEAAIPGLDLETYATEYTLRDTRGNAVKFAYTYGAEGGVGQATTEHIILRFTSDATGGRLWKIERTIRYPNGQQASMEALRQSIAEKYGRATLVELYPHQNRDEITYTWEKRPIDYFPDQDVSKRGFAGTNPVNINPCLLLVDHGRYAEPYDFKEPGIRKGNPGWDVCIGGIQFIIFYGSNANTVRELKIVASDYARQMHDARTLDQMLSDMLDQKANGVTGEGAPQL